VMRAILSSMENVYPENQIGCSYATAIKYI